ITTRRPSCPYATWNEVREIGRQPYTGMVFGHGSGKFIGSRVPRIRQVHVVQEHAERVSRPPPLERSKCLRHQDDLPPGTLPMPGQSCRPLRLRGFPLVAKPESRNVQNGIHLPVQDQTVHAADALRYRAPEEITQRTPQALGPELLMEAQTGPLHVVPDVLDDQPDVRV